MELIWRRPDPAPEGSFVAIVGGFPYHVLPGDPLWPEALAAAAELGHLLPFEPLPPVRTTEELLAEWRAGAVLTRLQFALQAVHEGKITAAEAEAWCGAGAIPALGQAALDLIEDPVARVEARIRFAGAWFVRRLDPFLPAIQAAAEWTDEQVDDFFRDGANL